jgi:hypothetical protein
MIALLCFNTTIPHHVNVSNAHKGSKIFPERLENISTNDFKVGCVTSLLAQPGPPRPLTLFVQT